MVTRSYTWHLLETIQARLFPAPHPPLSQSSTSLLEGLPALPPVQSSNSRGSQRRIMSLYRKTRAPSPQLSLRWICSKASAMEHITRGFSTELAVALSLHTAHRGAAKQETRCGLSSPIRGERLNFPLSCRVIPDCTKLTALNLSDQQSRSRPCSCSFHCPAEPPSKPSKQQASRSE